MIQILFVCLGNICRSPLAEAIFKQKIKDAGLENMLWCDSAGTANYHVGDAPDPRTVQVAANHQVPVHHTGQQFKRRMAGEFQYLIAMDHSNFRNMIAEIGHQPDSLYLMRDFDDRNLRADVPDPYYGGADGFEEVYQILDRSLDKFLQFLIDRHHLSA